MKKIKLFFLVIVSASCIDPIALKVPGSGGVLVVDGWITNLPGPYEIKLSKSIAYDNSSPLKVYTIPETNAKLSIVDDSGNTEVLVATTTPGSYKTTALAGIVGKSYQLQIETSNGKKYRSAFEELKPVPGISAVQAEYQVSETLFINSNGSARTSKKEDFGIYVTINDPATTENYYRWKAEGTFEFFSVTDFPAIKQCWAPKPGRVESKLEVASDLYFDGQSYRHYLGVIPYDRPTMYLVRVRQQSLTASAYDFLNKVRDQQSSTGTLFDSPATPIRGNVYNVDDSQETVLGYFGASAETQASVLINRFALSGFVNPSRYIAPRNGDCRTHEPFATNIKPEGF